MNLLLVGGKQIGQSSVCLSLCMYVYVYIKVDVISAAGLLLIAFQV